MSGRSPRACGQRSVLVTRAGPAPVPSWSHHMQIQVTPAHKAKLGGSDAAQRTRGCRDGSWDALPAPWAGLAASSRDHFQLPEHLIFDPVCSTATGTAWLCVHTCAEQSQRCQELPGLCLPGFSAGASAAAHPWAHQSRALHFIPLLAPYWP